MKIKPLGEYLFVQPRFEKLEGRILKPEASRGVMTYGDVSAIGPNVKSIKIGDVVWYSSWTGVKIDTHKVDTPILIRESEIIGIVEEE